MNPNTGPFSHLHVPEQKLQMFRLSHIETSSPFSSEVILIKQTWTFTTLNTKAQVTWAVLLYLTYLLTEIISFVRTAEYFVLLYFPIRTCSR